MTRSSCFLTLALSSLLLASSAAAQQPPPSAAPPSAALPPGYYPPPPAYPQPHEQPYGAPPLRTTRSFSPPMVVTGLVLTSVGAIAFGFGTIAWLLRDGVVCSSGSDGGSCARHGGDTVMMVAGGIATLAGIPLIAIGARSVPVKHEESALIPAISVSPRGASLTFTF